MYVPMGFMALITALPCAPGLRIQYCQCQSVGKIVVSHICDHYSHRSTTEPNPSPTMQEPMALTTAPRGAERGGHCQGARPARPCQLFHDSLFIECTSMYVEVK